MSIDSFIPNRTITLNGIIVRSLFPIFLLQMFNISQVKQMNSNNNDK